MMQRYSRLKKLTPFRDRAVTIVEFASLVACASRGNADMEACCTDRAPKYNNVGLNCLAQRVQVPNISGLWFQKPFRVWLLGPGSLNIRYLDP